MNRERRALILPTMLLGSVLLAGSAFSQTPTVSLRDGLPRVAFILAALGGYTCSLKALLLDCFRWQLPSPIGLPFHSKLRWEDSNLHSSA